eukprot:GFUD01040642.1.p1 GENE.GFUD01040642.1~~GFUD01040642.1.p1  ORF type:complete len:217 (+),score=90.86 GFUD01040642.1:69-719(+)
MSGFQLRDALHSAEFSGRMADVFSGLGSGQVKADKDDLKRMRDAKPDFDKQQMERSGQFKETGQFRESDEDDVVQFKRPRLENNPRGRGGNNTRGRGGKMPGFKKNPDGYTKYSLADVPDVSDRSNSSAAFDFLRKIKEGKEDSEPEIPADLSQRVVFKKRVAKDKSEKVTTDKESDDTNNIECSDKKEEKKKSSKSKNKSNQMTLSHLGEDEEDE